VVVLLWASEWEGVPEDGARVDELTERAVGRVESWLDG
jgi:hypothetical protein